MNMRHLSAAPAFLLIIAIAGCDTVGPIGPDPVEQETVGILVGAQGAFGQDTGGLVRFNLDGTVAGRYPAGDGLYVQSNDVIGDRVFVTTGDRVDVLDPTTLQRTAQFSIPSPRYVAADDDVLFVTSLYTNPSTFGDGAVTRIDLASGTAGEPVIIGGNPEGIAATGNRVVVANHDFGGGSTVTIFNDVTLAEVERVEVCEGPRFVFATRQNEVTVVCEGGGWGDDLTNGAFVVLDVRTGSIISRTDLDAPLRTAGSGQTATFSPGLQEIHAVDNTTRTVYRFNTSNYTLTATFNVGGAPINAIAFDEVRGYLMLGRFAGNPYTAQGTLTIHDRGGVLLDTFQGAGIAPTHVVVLTEEE